MNVDKLSDCPKHQLTRRIDVIGQRFPILSAMQKLVHLDGDLVKAAREQVIDPIWGPMQADNEIHGLLKGSRNYRGFHVELTGSSVLSPSMDTDITGCVVIGRNPLSHAIRPIIRDSIVLGNDALRGSAIFSGLNPEQISAFALAVNGSIKRDREQHKTGIKVFDSLLPEREKALIARKVSKAGQDIYEQFAGYKDLALAAYKVYGMLRYLLHNGDTYKVDINNSVVLGREALAHVLGGIVSNSIIGGEAPLSGASVRIVNSYVVTKEGVRYVTDNKMGNPDSFGTTSRFRRTEFILRVFRG